MSTETKYDSIKSLCTATGNPVVKQCLREDGTVDCLKLKGFIPEVYDVIANAKKRARSTNKDIPELKDWIFCPLCGHPAIDSLGSHLTTKHGGRAGVEQELNLEPGDFLSDMFTSERVREKCKESGALGNVEKEKLHEALKAGTWNPEENKKQARRVAEKNPELLKEHGYDPADVLARI